MAEEEEERRWRRQRKERGRGGSIYFNILCAFFFLLYCQTNRNNRSCSRELEISKLKTYVYAAVCTQTENVGYFLSTDYYYCCIFIFTELGIFETPCTSVTIFTHLPRPGRT